eukprot:scaffold4907_cov122-Isochrysis_galbana.AAC.16
MASTWYSTSSISSVPLTPPLGAAPPLARPAPDAPPSRSLRSKAATLLARAVSGSSSSDEHSDGSSSEEASSAIFCRLGAPPAGCAAAAGCAGCGRPGALPLFAPALASCPVDGRAATAPVRRSGAGFGLGVLGCGRGAFVPRQGA